MPDQPLPNSPVPAPTPQAPRPPMPPPPPPLQPQAPRPPQSAPVSPFASQPPRPPQAPPPPPVAPSAPVPPSAASQQDAELAKLSPFEVMKNRPAVPAPSRDELLRQASQVPATSFILPNDGGRPAAPAAPPAPASQPPRPPQAPPPPAPPLPLQQNRVPEPPRPAAILEASVQPPKPPIPPRPVQVPVPMVASRPARKGNGLAAGIAVALIFLFVVGGGYALAFSGVQVPLLYTMVSGLDSDGLHASQQAVVVATASSGYDQTGGITLSRAAGTGKPALPSSNPSPSPSASPSASPAVTITPTAVVSTMDNQGISLHGSFADGSWVSQSQLVVDSGTPVPVSLKVPASGTTWNAYLSSNTAGKLVQVDSTKLSQTALYPVLDIPSFRQAQSSFKTASGYQKQTVGGTTAATYQYTLDTSKLASILPDGATVSAGTGTASYAWKTRLPVAFSLSLKYSYQGDTYTYRGTFALAHWGGASTLTGDDITAFSGSDQGVATNPLSLAGQLGIASGALPTQLPPAASFTAITPSGQSVTTVTDAITAAPPAPATSATSEAITRDTQRAKDLTDLQTALAAYKAANGSYPVVFSMQETRSSQALLSALVPTYLTAMPVDPLPSTYWYEYTSVDGTTYLLRSVAENPANPDAKQGAAYFYFQRTN